MKVAITIIVVSYILTLIVAYNLGYRNGYDKGKEERIYKKPPIKEVV